MKKRRKYQTLNDLHKTRKSVTDKRLDRLIKQAKARG